MTEFHSTLHYVTPLSRTDPRRAGFPPEEQGVLDTINQKIAGEPSLSEVMDFLFETIREIYPCDRIGLAFIEEDGKRIVSHYAKALYGPLRLGKGYAEDLAGSSLKPIIEHQTPRIIYDLARYEEEHPRSASTRLLVREGVRSSLTCPLAVDDRAFGVIFLSSRMDQAYTPYHIKLWMAIAERLSQAVEKAYRIEQLLAANKAYTEILAFVSHELKNPIASMMTDARVLAMGYMGDLDPKQVEKLNRLIGKGEYLLDLIREYLDLARVEGGQLALRPRAVDLVTDVLEPAIDLVMPQIQAMQQTLARVFPTSAEPAECDPSLLKIVLVNFLGNASKYGNQGGRIRVEYSLHPGRFRVSVWNEGPGFPVEERPRLFRKFSRLQSPELKGRKGTGVGLYTCWRIALLHGGRTDAESEQGHWAEFSLEIPQPLPEPETP